MSQQDKLNPSLIPGGDMQRSLQDRVGVFIQATDTANAIARIQDAEQAGVQQIWMAAGDAGFADILTVFAGAATRTERIRLGTSIVPIYPRHPLMMAQQVLAIHDLAPGRLRLGIGSGDRMLTEHVYGIPQSAPLRYLKEYLEVLRSALWEGTIDHQGEAFHVKHTLPRTTRTPLLIPALGLKAFRLAGEMADGVLPAMCPVPYLLDQALPALQAGAAAKNRPVPPVVAHVSVALSTDDAAILAAIRPQMQWAVQTSTYAHMFAQAGFAAAVDGDEAGLNALTRTLVVSGSEATVRDRLRELLASGLDELLIALVPIADEVSERERLYRLISSL